MKDPRDIAQKTAHHHFDTYEGSAEDVGHPDGQPIVETWPALIDCITEAVSNDRQQRLRVGDRVEHINHAGLDSREIIALGSDKGEPWLWLDFQQSELDEGYLPTRLPAANYRRL